MARFNQARHVFKYLQSIFQVHKLNPWLKNVQNFIPLYYLPKIKARHFQN